MKKENVKALVSEIITGDQEEAVFFTLKVA